MWRSCGILVSFRKKHFFAFPDYIVLILYIIIYFYRSEKGKDFKERPNVQKNKKCRTITTAKKYGGKNGKVCIAKNCTYAIYTYSNYIYMLRSYQNVALALTPCGRPSH